MNKTNGFNSKDPEPDPEKSGRRKFSFRKIKTFDSFKISAYRIYYCAAIGEWVGMTMQMMVLSLLIYRLTGSGAMIGIMAIAQAIPQLCLALFGGAIADRFPKKYVLIFGQISTGIVALLLAFGLSSGFISESNPASWGLLVLSAVIQGIIMGLMIPAQMSIIPEIVGQERVMNAMSMVLMGQTVIRLAAPAAAGFLIDAYGFSAIYYLMAGVYFFSVIFAFFLPKSTVKITGSQNTFTDVIQGLRYIRGESYMLLIVVFTLCHVIAGQPYMQLMPIFTEDILKVGASGLGILASVSGTGAIIGSLIIASLPNKKRGILLITSGIIMGVSVIVFAWSKSWALSLAIMPLAGLGPALHGTLTGTLIQYYAKPEYRGRTQSFVSMSAGLANFGTFFAGILTGAIGVEWAVGGMAVFLTIASVLFLALARPLTRLN